MGVKIPFTNTRFEPSNFDGTEFLNDVGGNLADFASLELPDNEPDEDPVPVRLGDNLSDVSQGFLSGFLSTPAGVLATLVAGFVALEFLGITDIADVFN